MVWFAPSGLCILANIFFWIGTEPRLKPGIRGADGCSAILVDLRRASSTAGIRHSDACKSHPVAQYAGVAGSSVLLEDLIMSQRTGTGPYIVPTHRWYIERTVWLIAGAVLLSSTALALMSNPLWILGVTATGLVSINVSLTGFCPVGNILRVLGFTPMLGTTAPTPWNLYFLQIDRWYLERRIYLAVGINISVASVLVLALSPWFALFTLFVGGAMVWFAATGYCIMANFLYWLGAEPRLNPQAMPSARCAHCSMASVCVSNPRLRPTHV
jgi:hypothetical protein